MKLVSVLSAFYLFSSQKPKIFNIQVGFDSIIHLALRLLRIFLQVLQFFGLPQLKQGQQHLQRLPSAATETPRCSKLKQINHWTGKPLIWKSFGKHKKARCLRGHRDMLETHKSTSPRTADITCMLTSQGNKQQDQIKFSCADTADMGMSWDPCSSSRTSADIRGHSLFSVPSINFQ